MIGTQWQKDALAYRRENRDMLAKGWEWVGEGGGLLWELERGRRWSHRITDVRIGLGGKGLWVLIQPPERDS